MFLGGYIQPKGGGSATLDLSAVAQHYVVTADGTYDLGDSTNAIRVVYTDAVTAPGQLVIDSATGAGNGIRFNVAGGNKAGITSGNQWAFIRDVAITWTGHTSNPFSGIDTSLLRDAASVVRVHGASASAAGFFHTDRLSVVNTAEGGTGRFNILTAREVHTLAAAGTSDTTTLSIPSGARLLGASFNVDTAVSDDAGDDTWSAAFVTGSSTSLASGAAAAQNTKVDTQVVDELTTDVTQIRFTANGGNFDAGVIEVVVYYTTLTSLGDAA